MLLVPQTIYQQIQATLGTVPAEAGGILALQGQTLRDYYFDSCAGTGKSFYEPSADTVSRQVNRWLQSGLGFAGFIHSHRPPHVRLSPMDILAAERTMSLNRLSVLYMAIVCDSQLYFYKVTAQPGAPRPSVEPCPWQLIAEPPSASPGPSFRSGSHSCG